MSTLQAIISKLESRYGVPHRAAVRPAPIDELVSTILSQHTSDTNTARAFQSLKAAFLDWDEVISAPTSSVAHAIRSGGLSNQKAPRIQGALLEVKNRRGNFDLDFLASHAVDEALAWLTSMHGVGPKTASCVLLFALNLPVMPVDTHVHRVALRLGLLEAGTSAERAHRVLEEDMSGDEVYRAHMLLIRHGRETCRARVPRCDACVLNDRCPAAPAYLLKDKDMQPID